MLVIEAPPNRRAEREYILAVILGDELGLDFRLVPGEHASWRVSLTGEAGVVTMPDLLLGLPSNEWLTPASLPERPLRRWAPRQLDEADGIAESIPIVYGRFDESSPQEETLPVDVFGSAFFMLTRYEELVMQAVDEHGRFPGTSSISVADGFVDRPVVNELTDALWHALAAQWPRLRRKQRTFTIELTHDVDWISTVQQPASRVARLIAGDLLRRRDPVLCAQRLAAVTRDRAGWEAIGDPADTFDFIMDASEERGLRSSFYFIGDADRRPPFHNDVYSLDAPRVQRLLRAIHDRGHEIGLHGSYDTWIDAKLLTSELDRLRMAAARAGVQRAEWGGRQHFLRFAASKTWSTYEAAGLAYDASIGFADQPGFRCGIAGPFRVFDLAAGRMLDLIERPLIAMEGSFLDRRYGALSLDEAVERMLALADTCRRRGGVFTLLWHNTSLMRKREREAYRDLLDGLTASR